MKASVLSLKGEEIRTIELNDAVFGIEVSEGCIFHAIRNELANCRVGTADTKTRKEINATSKKPWKQKGTGRARSGSRRSPVWVGGGIVFGPHPRDYHYAVPKKVKRLAMKSILSKKVKDQTIRIVEDFSVGTGKTKDLVAILKNIALADNTVVILKDDDAMVKRAGRNVPGLSVLSYNRLRAHDLFYGRSVILLETAAKKLNDFYA